MDDNPLDAAAGAGGGGNNVKQCMENATKLCPDYPEKCTKCGAYREQTNADRIRSMSDFKLAKEIENAQSGMEGRRNEQ